MAYNNKKNTKNKSNFNKDSKNKLNAKKDMKQREKTDDNVDQKSYYPDYSQNLSLISRLRTGKPGSIVKVRHFEVGAVDVGNIDYLKSHITSAINTLATQRGYESTVEFSTIENYVDKLINLEIAATTFVRTQNLLQVEDMLGNKVAKAFYTLSQDYVADPNLFYGVGEFIVPTGKQAQVFAESVSNHQYSTSFVSPMSKLLTTPHLHGQIQSYFGVVHADINSNDDSVFSVLWNELTITKFSELLDLIDDIRSIILNYPDLELILRSIGFSSFEEIGEEFQRDRLQKSMTIRNDGFLDAMLHNSKVNIELVRTSNTLPAQVVYTTNNSYPDTFLNDVSSTLTIMDPQATGVSAINKIAYTTLKMFATGMVYRNYNVIARQSNGTFPIQIRKPINAVAKWHFASTVVGSSGGPGTGKINADLLNNLFSAFTDIDMLIPDDGTQQASLSYVAASAPDPASLNIEIQTITENQYKLNDSGNRLSVSDALDATLYLDNRKVFLLYGIVE